MATKVLRLYVLFGSLVTVTVTGRLVSHTTLSSGQGASGSAGHRASKGRRHLRGRGLSSDLSVMCLPYEARVMSHISWSGQARRTGLAS